MSTSEKRPVGEETESRPSGSIPSPQRKRHRGDLIQEVLVEPEAEPDEVILVVDEAPCAASSSVAPPSAEPSAALSSAGPCTDTETVPCEVCGASVPFSEFVVHMSTCTEADVPNRDPSEDITCDVCGETVAFSRFVEHSKKHSAEVELEGAACQVCGVWIGVKDLDDHLAAHKIHEQWLDREIKTSTSPVDITAQLVEMARAGGAGLPGNRRNVGRGDEVLVRWSDGHWYHGHVRDMQQPGEDKISVAWDPPFEKWAPERVSEQAVIPRMNQPREVCNFDVALEFVKKLCSMKDDSTEATELEVVYHWTGEENVQKIVENNLKPPGATNADGSEVKVLNGEALGKGIYAATDLNFGKGFGRGLSCAFLCLGIPGHVGRKKEKGKLSGRDDSFRSGQVRVYRSSEQVLPLFFTDSKSSTKLAQCAENIADLLKERVLGQLEHAQDSESEFKKGSKVECLCDGTYYKAQITKVRRSGTFDVRWLAPYHLSPGEHRVKAERLRKY